jgi:hypothetical protein
VIVLLSSAECEDERSNSNPLWLPNRLAGQPQDTACAAKIISLLSELKTLSYQSSPETSKERGWLAVILSFVDAFLSAAKNSFPTVEGTVTHLTLKLSDLSNPLHNYFTI